MLITPKDYFARPRRVGEPLYGGRAGGGRVTYAKHALAADVGGGLRGVGVRVVRGTECRCSCMSVRCRVHRLCLPRAYNISVLAGRPLEPTHRVQCVCGSGGETACKASPVSAVVLPSGDLAYLSLQAEGRSTLTHRGSPDAVQMWHGLTPLAPCGAQCPVVVVDSVAVSGATLSGSRLQQQRSH